MSLSWRKRQAKASDQKTWRALGTDSALWKGIEKNSGNVKVALGGTMTEGIVTGLKMEMITGSAPQYAAINNSIIYVSDPSNAALSATKGINLFTTPIDSSHNVLGNGLEFHIQNFSGTGSGPIPPSLTDLSGQKICILKGGSGYGVGETFSMGCVDPYLGNGVLGVITSVTSTKIEPGRN